MITEPVKLFKALSDNSRIRIVSRLMETPMYVEVLAERLDLAPSTVSFHLKKLLDAGLVEKKKEQYYVVYSSKADVLKLSLKEIICLEKDEFSEDDDREANYRKKVIDNFFKNGKLVSIPVQRKKRRIILDELIKAFEFDVKYTEREVNINIADFHDDFATLRREFICEKLMDRKNSVYWRI